MSSRSAARKVGRRVARRAMGVVPAGVRGTAFRALAPRLRIGGTEHGLVTVVVVVEAVDAPRLPDTLASVAGQTHAYREVLVVPVGPAAAEAVRRAARARPDPRVRSLRAAGTWQEAATAGAEAARGRWLLWLRGCDLLPPPALPSLAGSLSASGSDLAVGTTEQRGEPEEWLRRSQARAHAHPGRGLDPADHPELAGDLVVGNRLVDAAAWRRTGLRFGPEDAWLVSPTVARLLATGPTVDVVDVPASEHLHDHGLRAFGATPSALPELADWPQRDAAVRSALRGSPLLDGWLAHVRDVVVPRFLRDAERASEEEWGALRALAADGGETDDEGVGAEARALARLARDDRRADLEALVAEALELGPHLRTTVVDGEVRAVWASWPADLPAVRLDDAETGLRAAVQRVRALGDRLEVDLFARIDHVEPHDAEVSVDPGEVASARPDPAATRWGQSRFQRALAVTLRVPDGTTEVVLTVRVGRLSRRATVLLEPAAAPDPRPDRRVTLTGLTLEKDHLAVTTDGDPRLLRLVDDHDRVVATADGSGRIDLRTRSFGREHWLATGRRRLLTDRGSPALGPDLAAALPVERVGAHHRLRAHLGPHGGPVVWLGPPLGDDEQGPWAQERLVEAYRRDDEAVDHDVAYFESYAGRSATDSPRAVHDALRARRPDVTTYWGVLDHAQWVPEGAVPVLLRSRAWYAVLARAGLVVTNTDPEAWFVRRPGQVVLQTFHGYPSKGMGRGQWAAKDLPPSRVRLLERRGVDTWSAILTPTPEMTRHYREQYGYDGLALERGYPRDDDLTRPDPARRARVRALLGVRDDQTAVLYAPTWRDHLAHRARGADLGQELDVAAAAAALGDGHVLLLRGHRFHQPAPVPGVVDVTEHPEVNDLLHATDVAVLDYSSLRFDVALLGTPMVFLVPDLADYTSGSRAFLHPFEDSAPGPLVTDTAGVVAEVRDVAALRERWAGELAAFNARFHPHQDGHATDRVVDALLALVDEARGR